MFRYDLISQAMEKEQNKFLLVHILAKRMHQLADGAHPLGTKTHNSYFNNSLQEFLDGAVEFKDKESEGAK